MNDENIDRFGGWDGIIEYLHKDDDPKFAVITPLYSNHRISATLLLTIQSTNTPYIWISVEGKSNIPTNLDSGLRHLREKSRMPEFYIMLDRDIELQEGCLDKLYNVISKQPDEVALAYASFCFRGHINIDFPAVEWNLSRLIRGNYISSNSMFRSSVTEKVGLVTDDKYKRLLDWAFLLKLASYNYRGVPCPDASFIAHSEKGDISAGSRDEYILNHQAVVRDFVLPLTGLKNIRTFKTFY